MAINFNGKNIPSFVKVNNIVNSILPSISQTTMKINNKAGMVDFGNEIGTRSIQVMITIIADSITDLREKVRILANWLYYEEAKKLYILEEPSIYYMAKFTGDSFLNEILSIGQGTLTFICNDPFGFGEEKTYSFFPTSSVPYGFLNNGNTETYPKIEFDFMKDSTELSIISSDEHLYFGNPIEAGISIPTDQNPMIFNEEFSNLNGWTQGISVEDGAVAGNFISNGWSISMEDFDGSAYPRFVGPSMIKSLPYPVQDFKIRCRMGLKGTKPEQLGRVHVYGLDSNGQRVFLQEFRDGNVKAISPYARTIIGNKEVVATYGSYMGVWANGAEDAFMDIARRGNEWSIYYCLYDPVKKIQHTRLHKVWIDEKKLNMSKIVSLQIHIGKFSNVEKIPYMYFQTLKLYDESPVLAENEVPFAFKKNDNLMIDCESGMITLNGEEFYQYLDPSSKFIKMRKGMNGISISPYNVVTNGRVTFRERWL